MTRNISLSDKSSPGNRTDLDAADVCGEAADALALADGALLMIDKLFFRSMLTVTKTT